MLVAESGPQFLTISADLNGRFGEKRTFCFRFNSTATSQVIATFYLNEFAPWRPGQMGPVGFVRLFIVMKRTIPAKRAPRIAQTQYREMIVNWVKYQRLPIMQSNAMYRRLDLCQKLPYLVGFTRLLPLLP